MHLSISLLDPLTEFSIFPGINRCADSDQGRRNSSRRVSAAVFILDAVDPDAQYPIPACDALLYLVRHVFAICGFRPNQYNGYGRAVEAAIDKLFDGYVAFLRRFFPQRCIV